MSDFKPILIQIQDKTGNPALLETLKLIKHPLIHLYMDIEDLVRHTTDQADPLWIVITQPSDQPIFYAGEIAQACRMVYPQAHLYFVATLNDEINREFLIQNGCEDVFTLPFDQKLLASSFERTLAEFVKISRVYETVKLIDLEPQTVLNFDAYVYMPLNNKHVLFLPKGEAIAEERLGRLKKNHHANVHIPKEHLEKFYHYTASRLHAIQAHPAMSHTEKSERLRQSVRELIGQIFSKDVATKTTADGMLSTFHKIIDRYIDQSTQSKLFERINAVSSDHEDTYSHASNTATYAVLFAMGLGIEAPEDLGIAGFLHDIGLALVPEHILTKTYEEMDPNEKSQYEKHPEYTLQLIQSKKLTLSNRILDIILQHHEKYNGSGYPRHLSGPKILKEAQILGIADYFDELMTLVPGKPRLSPQQAIDKLKEVPTGDPSSYTYEPELYHSILNLFNQE